MPSLLPTIECVVVSKLADVDLYTDAVVGAALFTCIETKNETAGRMDLNFIMSRIQIK